MGNKYSKEELESKLEENGIKLGGEIENKNLNLLQNIIKSESELMIFIEFKKLYTYYADNKLIINFYKIHKENIEKICWLEQEFRKLDIINLGCRFTLNDMNYLVGIITNKKDIENFYQIWKGNHKKYGLNYILSMYNKHKH